MAAEIRPTSPDDLAELCRFLTEGFHAPADAPFAAPDVLRWKYFDPRGDSGAPRSYVAVDEGRIVGHIGLATGSFIGDAVTSGEVTTLHMIDWLSARRGTSIGASLMLRSHRGFATGFGLGGSDAGRSVGGGGGYQLVETVPVFRRVLRLGRSGGPIRLAKDLVRKLLNPKQALLFSVELKPVREFGAEIEPILERYKTRAVFTNRRPELLNHILRYPRGGISGWLLLMEGQIHGFGLTSIVRQGQLRIGKVVDCVLDGTEPNLWHAAVDALTNELHRSEADVAEGFGSTPWMNSGLCLDGYHLAHHLEFRLRDKHKLIAPGSLFHVTPLEADYAYT